MSDNTKNLFVRASILVRPHDSESSEVYNLNDRSQQIVPRRLLSLLSSCNEARSLEGHCSHIENTAPGRAGDGFVLNSLKELLDRGLLRRVTLPVASGSTRASVPTTQPEALQDAEIVVPTAGRPAVTARLLRSLQASAQDSQPAPAHIVLDSVSPRMKQELTKAIDRSLSSESPIAWTITDRGTRARTVTRLGKMLSLDHNEAEALSFGLVSDQTLGVTTGATHTYSLLSCRNSALISIDDDVHCSGVTGNTDSVPRISASGDITLRYRRDRTELLKSFPPSPIDIRKATAGLLGKTLSEIRTSAGAVDWRPSEISPALWYRLERHDPTVDGVVLGHLGDSGVGNSPTLPSTAVSIPQLFGTADYQDLALHSKEMIRLAEVPTITTQPFFMTTVFALSLNKILPPFFPFGRGQDWTFGSMLTQLFDDSVVGHVPVALLHDPRDGRASRLERPPDRITHGVNRLLLTLISHYAAMTTGGSREDRLIDFGQWLREHSAEGPETFRSWITDIACTALTQYGAGIERSYPGTRGTDSPLGRTVTNLLADIERRVAAKDIGPVTEYAALGLGEAETFERMAHHFSLFGTFMELWPAIWAERSVLWDTER